MPGATPSPARFRVPAGRPVRCWSWPRVIVLRRAGAPVRGPDRALADDPLGPAPVGQVGPQQVGPQHRALGARALLRHAAVQVAAPVGPTPTNARVAPRPALVARHQRGAAGREAVARPGTGSVRAPVRADRARRALRPVDQGRSSPGHDPRTGIDPHLDRRVRVLRRAHPGGRRLALIVMGPAAAGLPVIATDPMMRAHPVGPGPRGVAQARAELPLPAGPAVPQRAGAPGRAGAQRRAAARATIVTPGPRVPVRSSGAASAARAPRAWPTATSTLATLSAHLGATRGPRRLAPTPSGSVSTTTSASRLLVR
ncbi:MAG: hypothetical protein JWM89_757 [Acidimicrobiales bacterium]|nr:hypothetical protein [Acidimicrobiales bacterium]